MRRKTPPPARNAPSARTTFIHPFTRGRHLPGAHIRLNRSRAKRPVLLKDTLLARDALFNARSNTRSSRSPHRLVSHLTPHDKDDGTHNRKNNKNLDQHKSLLSPRSPRQARLHIQGRDSSQNNPAGQSRETPQIPVPPTQMGALIRFLLAYPRALSAQCVLRCVMCGAALSTLVCGAHECLL
jgi:hypothetical protein